MSMGGKMWIFDGTSGPEICQYDIHVWPISNVIFVGAVLLHFYVFLRQNGLKKFWEAVFAAVLLLFYITKIWFVQGENAY